MTYFDVGTADTFRAFALAHLPLAAQAHVADYCRDVDDGEDDPWTGFLYDRVDDYRQYLRLTDRGPLGVSMWWPGCREPVGFPPVVWQG